jgi:hypothetical protein
VSRFRRDQDKLRPTQFQPGFCANTRKPFLLTKDGKESMNIRDVTFEELLAMLRRSPKLVAKERPLKIPTVIKLATPIFANSQRPLVAN